MNSTHYEDFCSRMKNYRKRLGYNQTEMGKKLGISQDDYSKRENGHIIVSFNNMKSLHENGIDIDELVCGKSSNVSTEELDIVMSEYDDSTRPFAMKIIAESIMHYRHLEIMSGRQVTDEDRLLDYMLKQWDEFTMLEYVRTVMHYSQDTMLSKLYVTRKKYRKYEKEIIYPDADTLVNMYNVYNYRPSMYLNLYDRRYYVMQRIWMEFNDEQKNKVMRMGNMMKEIL